MARLTPERFKEVNAYLNDKNDVSLRLLLSSSTRGCLSAVCRRINVLDQLSGKAIVYYRRQLSTTEPGKTQGRLLYQAYQRMQQVSSSSLIKVVEIDKLLTQLATDIRDAYSTSLPSLVKRATNPPQGKDIDNAIKAARIHSELVLLVSTNPPPAFLPIVKKLFTVDLVAFRKTTEPSKLFFADYSLLELEDDEKSLAARKAKHSQVDSFRRSMIKMTPTKQWRRCVRCAAVMEDVSGTRPGFTIILRNQHRCLCGGSWAMPMRGKTRQ